MVPPSASGKDGDSLRSLHLHAGTKRLLQSVHRVGHTIMVAGATMKGIVIDFQATEVIQIVHHTGATGALQGGDLQEAGEVEASHEVLVITEAVEGIGAGLQPVVPAQGTDAQQ
uniref:Uncharacterized protein n=1 Tax=Opuntia streptacantha TaxID=393608 RepID=A0A7C9EA52_OPUST